MDGLDDQAEAAAESIIDQLYTNHTVQVKHSSRDSLMLRVTQALKENKHLVQAKKLVFRSGISAAGLRWLEEALGSMDANQQMEELEFVCLNSIETLETAILCCRRLGIQRLSLTTYGARARTSRVNRPLLASTIRSGLLLTSSQEDAELVDDHQDRQGTNHHQVLPCEKKLRYLAISQYPLGSEGAQIVGEAVAQYSSCLQTLKLVDCDLRSDCATTIANLIRTNTRLEYLDLSYNRHYNGTGITREMTMKTLVRRGLIHNLGLLEIKMDQTQGETMKRTKIDRQLDINRFRKSYLEQKRDPWAVHPHLYSHLLARVSPKPSALYFFLQEGIPTMF